MKSAVHVAMDRLYLACMWIAGIAIVAMSLIIPWGVFARYVLGTGSQWPEPVALLLMTVFTFLGGAVAYRAGSHIAVEMFVGGLPDGPRRVFSRIADLLVLALALFLTVWGFKLVHETMGQTLAALPWLPVGITYLPMPIAGVVTALFVLEKLAYGSQHLRPVCVFELLLEEPAAGPLPAAAPGSVPGVVPGTATSANPTSAPDR